MGCGKAMEQVVETRYSARVVPAKCGQTSVYGYIRATAKKDLLDRCEACRKLQC